MVGSGQLVSLWNLETGACVNEFKGHKGRYVMYIISTAIKKMHLQNLRLICIKLDSVRKLKLGLLRASLDLVQCDSLVSQPTHFFPQGD